MWTADKESLCNSHDTIKYWANDIKKKLKKAVKTEDYSNIENLIPTLDDLIIETRLAKKKGQKLENRLIKYRRSVESLGFKRVSK